MPRMAQKKNYRIETRSVHAGSAENLAGAVAPPIHLSTTFRRDPDGSLASDFIYGRSGNPDRTALEQAIADLEEGAECVSFASGLAAVHSLLLTLSPGDLVLAPQDAYHGTVRLAKESLARWGLRTRFTDFLDPEDVAAGLDERPALAILETPSNPTLRVTDIAAVAARCRAVGALVAVDNTWMTPVLQRPLALGADIVIHATTKYFGGHSDVTGGAAVLREGLELASRLRFVQTETGPVPSPFDAWLLRRGMKTLPIRIRAQSKTAGKLAVVSEQPSPRGGDLLSGAPFRSRTRSPDPPGGWLRRDAFLPGWWRGRPCPERAVARPTLRSGHQSRGRGESHRAPSHG